MDTSQGLISAVGGQDLNALEFVGAEVHVGVNGANNAMVVDEGWSGAGPITSWVSHPSAIGYRLQGAVSAGSGSGGGGRGSGSGSGGGGTITIAAVSPDFDSGMNDGTDGQELKRVANFYTGTEENPTSTQSAPTPRAEQDISNGVPSGNPIAVPTSTKGSSDGDDPPPSNLPPAQGPGTDPGDDQPPPQPGPGNNPPGNPFPPPNPGNNPHGNRPPGPGSIFDRPLAGLQSTLANIWGYTGGALYNRFLSNGQKLGAGYGAILYNNTCADLGLVRNQRERLAKQLADPNAQTAATEMTVGQNQAANALLTGNFVSARTDDADVVNNGIGAGAAMALDTYTIFNVGMAARGAVARAAVRNAAAKVAPKVVPTGQIRHPISTKIGRELNSHPTLSGQFQPRDPGFTTQAIDEAAHRGYQT